MFTTFKRLAFAVSVPAVLALGGWAQWTTLTTDVATAGISTAAVARVDIVRETEQLNAGAADPRINPAPSPDRTAGDGTTGQAEPPAPVVKANTEFAQANAAPPEPSIEPAAAAERGAGEKAELAGQQPPNSSTNRSSTMETKERQALPRETQEDGSRREQEQEGEFRRSKSDSANARKAVVAKRQKAKQARQQWNGPSALALRDHPMRLRGPDGIGPREVRALITELRKSRSVEDLAARLDVLGRAAW
jgi:hypothetical protein